jgi:hypothetical protein
MSDDTQKLQKITISINKTQNNSKASKPGTSFYTSKELTKILEDQVEIKPKYIKYFYGCWVKCVSVNTRNYKSGGTLVNVDNHNKTVSLRPINSSTGENTIVSIKSNTFYVKKDTEQYKGMQNILIETEKLNHSVKLFEIKQQKELLEMKLKMKKIKASEKELFQEKINFDNFKFLFFKKVQEGKVIIKE